MTVILILSVLILGWRTGLPRGRAHPDHPERRSSNGRKIWKNVELSIVLATLFFVSWIGQASPSGIGTRRSRPPIKSP